MTRQIKVAALTLAIALAGCGTESTTVITPERGKPYYEAAKKKPPPGPTMVGMTNWPVTHSAIAIDSDGGIYHGQSKQWTLVGTTPSAPASIWSRSSTGTVFILLLNGDLYSLGADWSLTFDSNVLESAL